ncbi:MAG TPA: response regulator [Polyangiaceae bacterium]|jgi:CheY-like chemotaxis protein|nr:response regulator [Polyangiaceae bacterium]
MMKTVLVVEDTEDLREAYMAIISREGYRVIGAANGQHALDILEAGGDTPCLIVLDWMMPVMDGQTFLTALRKTRFASLPIVIVSAYAADDAGHQVKTVVQKPISYTTLTHLVREYCGDE